MLEPKSRVDRFIDTNCALGAWFTDLPKEGETLPIAGSMLIAVAESKDEVLARLKKDVYSTGEVWDWDKVRSFQRDELGDASDLTIISIAPHDRLTVWQIQIYPFKSAIRKGF
jgi:hypothetical protein